MLITRTLKTAMADTFNKVGKFFSLASTSSKVRVTLFKEGRAVLETDLRQGMSLSEIDFDNVQIISPIDQIIEYWASNVEYSYVAPSSLPSQIVGAVTESGAGMFNILEEDNGRVSSKITCDSILYIGGEDAVIVGGEPVNMRRFKPDEEIILTSTSRVQGWVSEDVIKVLLNAVSPIVIKCAPLGQTHTNSQLMAANIDYVDFYIPTSMDGVGIDIDLSWTSLSAGYRKVGLLYTAGDPNSEALTQITASTGTVGANYAVTVGLNNKVFSAGWHRLFFAHLTDEQTGKVLGDVSQVRFDSVVSDTVGFAQGAEILILTERL